MTPSYIAKLVTVTPYSQLSSEFRPFVDFRAQLEDFEVHADDEVAVLQIEGTQRFFPIFLERTVDITETEKELAKQDTKMNEETRAVILQHLNRKKQ